MHFDGYCTYRGRTCRYMADTYCTVAAVSAECSRTRGGSHSAAEICEKREAKKKKKQTDRELQYREPQFHVTGMMVDEKG